MLVVQCFEFLDLPHECLILLLLGHIELLTETMDLQLRLHEVLL